MNERTIAALADTMAAVVSTLRSLDREYPDAVVYGMSGGAYVIRQHAEGDDTGAILAEVYTDKVYLAETHPSGGES